MYGRDEEGIWMMAMAATLVGGKNVQAATANADAALAAFKSRFRKDDADEDDRDPD